MLKLFFQADSSRLTEDHKKVLSVFAAIPGLKIVSISGFSDSTSGDNYNLELSKKRANALYFFLSSIITIDSSVKPVYFGEKYSADYSLAYSRRVEVEFVRKPVVKKETAEVPAISERIELDNIYFKPDKSIIEAASVQAVMDVADALKKYKGCRFEIIGHVNYILPPSKKDDPKALAPVIKLSEERAKAVYDIFSEMGIPASVMIYKGAGNSQMLFPKPETEEQKRKNMRVEVIVYCDLH